MERVLQKDIFKLNITFVIHITLHESFICFSLAIIDSLLIVESIVTRSIIPHFTRKSPEEPTWFKMTFPYIWHPFKGMIVCSTIYMIFAVSAERFRAVCYPLSKHQVSIHFKENIKLKYRF